MALQAISAAAPLGLRWTPDPWVPLHTERPTVPSVTSAIGPGLRLTVGADGVAHLHGPPVPAATLRFVHQQAVILHQLLIDRVVLHGSTVAMDGKAVAVIGPSGAGKSTTAAALLATGAELLSDDVVVVDLSDGRLRALPAESHLRLRPGAVPATAEAATEASSGTTRVKVVLSQERPNGLPAPADLRIILALTCAAGSPLPRCTRLDGLAALDAVREFGGGRRGLEIHGRSGFLQRLARVADGVEVWRLDRRTDVPTPEAIAAEVTHLLRRS